jgi:hypothetical protein
MRNHIHPEFEMMLSHLERSLSRPGRAKAAATQEAKRMLSHMVNMLMQSPIGFDGSPDIRENMHLLMRRVDRAHTSDEIRELARDMRQYGLVISSSSQTREMENRLRELEGRIKVMAETAINPDSVGEERIITIEKLKEKRVLFAVMPFHEDFRDVWAGGIQRAANGTGLTPIRIDMITASGEVTDDIVTVIEMSEIVVVDVTRNNPNVMFEFGFALAKNKPHVVISQSTEFLTFDIKNVRTIMYQNTWQGIEKLHKDLQAFVKGTIGEKTSKRK